MALFVMPFRLKEMEAGSAGKALEINGGMQRRELVSEKQKEITPLDRRNRGFSLTHKNKK